MLRRPRGNGVAANALEAALLSRWTDRAKNI